ncbi:hypothetical protein K474DRAFT_1659352 [Panus rudis PR-1116 ss-1]|nr:hypothetical protein K474DRAFT_1659352 [Panus rudis PR-1116 ss-1]
MSTEIEQVWDTARLRDLLGSMTKNLDAVSTTVLQLNDQAAEITAVGPTMDQANEHIKDLWVQIKKQEKKQGLRANEVKAFIQDHVKFQVKKDLRLFIKERIASEVATQTRDEVDRQMKEHIPVSLREQIQGSRQQLKEVRNAITNSEARRQNSNLQPDNLNDPLATVLKADGTKSLIYPTNLNSLFAYDARDLRRLLVEHDLVVQDQREKNLNRFMAHIGIRFQLIPINHE